MQLLFVSLFKNVYDGTISMPCKNTIYLGNCLKFEIS
jgi:hypothetical protein